MATPTAEAVLLVTTLVVLAILLPAQAAPRRPQGCVYEGVVHAANSRVHTGEPCLNCTCLRGALVCHLKVCPDLPNPPPRGCILLHRKDECCPKLVCQDDTQLIGGPFQFNQDANQDDISQGSGCVVNGTVYAEGSAMASSTACEFCYCIRGRQQCVQPKCLLQLTGCQPAYTANTCCPTSYNCTHHMSDTQDETITTTTTTARSLARRPPGCMVGGERHAEGSQVKLVASSECENCFCVKGRVQCTPLAYAPHLQGCSPIIKEGECWPTSYNCSGITIDLQMTEHNFILKNTPGDRKLPNSVRSMPVVMENSQTETLDLQTELVNEGRANNKPENMTQNHGTESHTVNKTTKLNEAAKNKTTGLKGEEKDRTNTKESDSSHKRTDTSTTTVEVILTTSTDVTTERTILSTNKTDKHSNTTESKSVVKITEKSNATSTNKSSTDDKTKHKNTTNPSSSSRNKGSTVLYDKTTKPSVSKKSTSPKTVPGVTSTPKNRTTVKTYNTTNQVSTKPLKTNKTTTTNTKVTKTSNTITTLTPTTVTEIPNTNSSSTTDKTTSSIDTTLSDTTSADTTMQDSTSPTSDIVTTVPTTNTTQSNNSTVLSEASNVTTSTNNSLSTTPPTTEVNINTTKGLKITTTTIPNTITTTSNPSEVEERTESIEDSTEVGEETTTTEDESEEMSEDSKVVTADGTTESLNDIITMMDTTTIIMPEELLVVNVTMHSNLSIRENNKTEAIVTASPPPSRSIPPEIEAILNITRKKDEDYEYDYNEPSLPPSLPNLRIIPFVAADAVLETMDKGSPTIYPIGDKLRPTESPVFYKGSHPNLFSPPIETEGGFVPREPIIDGPFYESKFDLTYHTTNKNMAVDHLSLDITASTVTPQSITVPPKSKDDNCLSDGRDYHHGELLSKPDACIMCVCYFGEIHCQPPKCPTVKTGCRRVKEVEQNSCCGRIVCDDEESPTVVLDRLDVTMNPLQSPLLGGIVPPITVAEGVVTPDPFRDVIRTEAAPDLPSLIGNMNPYLLERHSPTHPTSTSPFPSLWSWTNLSSAEPASSTPRTTTPVTPAAHNTTTEPPSGVLTSKTPDLHSYNATIPPRPLVNQSHSSSAIRTTPPIDFTTLVPPGEEDIENFDKEDEDSFSLDNVFKLLFSGDEPTTPRPHTTTHAVSVSEFTQKTLQSIDRIDEFVDHNQTEHASPNTTSAAKADVLLSESSPTNPVQGATSVLLKLAGCNIYGRMYRVGRIISELSTPCRECMCTEVGVQCTKLSC